MTFTLHIIPPTCTGQMRRHTRNGRTYEPRAVKDARQLFRTALAPHRPSEPLCGPVSLTVRWYFPCGKTHHSGSWKATRPDADNIQKLLQDEMTKAGFWADDSRIAVLHVEKRWSDEPRIEIEVEELT